MLKDQLKLIMCNAFLEPKPCPYAEDFKWLTSLHATEKLGENRPLLLITYIYIYKIHTEGDLQTGSTDMVNSPLTYDGYGLISCFREVLVNLNTKTSFLAPFPCKDVFGPVLVSKQVRAEWAMVWRCHSHSPMSLRLWKGCIVHLGLLKKKKKAFQVFCVLISQKSVVVAGRQWLCVLNARGRGWKRRLLSAAPEDEPLCPATYLRYVQVNQVCAHRHIHSSVGYDIIIAN